MHLVFFGFYLSFLQLLGQATCENLIISCLSAAAPVSGLTNHEKRLPPVARWKMWMWRKSGKRGVHSVCAARQNNNNNKVWVWHTSTMNAARLKF